MNNSLVWIKFSYLGELCLGKLITNSEKSLTLLISVGKLCFLPQTLQCEYRSIQKSKANQFRAELKIHISGTIDTRGLQRAVLLQLCFKHEGRMLLLGYVVVF